MGLAFSSLNDHYQAKEYYKKAVELDPSNESYANNLKVAQEKIAELEVSCYLFLSILIFIFIKINKYIYFFGRIKILWPHLDQYLVIHR